MKGNKFKLEKSNPKIAKLISVSLVSVLFLMLSLMYFPCEAESAEQTSSPEIAKNIFIDSCIGLAIGGLIGLAIVATRDDPDWASGIGGGAAAGGIGGLIFGLIYESKPLFYAQNDEIKIQVPQITLKKDRQDISKEISLAYNIDLFQYEF